MTTHKKQTTATYIIESLVPVVFHFFKSVFFRIFMLPFYIFMLIPWLLLFLPSSSATVQTAPLRLIAFLAGKPGETSLDEGDLIKAAAVIFLGLNIIIEVVARVRRKDSAVDFGMKPRTSYIFKCIVSSVGWAICAVVGYKHGGYILSIMAIAMGVISCFFYLLETEIIKMFKIFGKLFKIN